MHTGRNLINYFLNEKVLDAVSEFPLAVIVNVPDFSQPDPPANVRVENCPFRLAFTCSVQTKTSSEFLIDNSI